MCVVSRITCTIRTVPVRFNPSRQKYKIILSDWLNSIHVNSSYVQQNGNGWRFVGERGSLYYNATNCCSGAVCVAELVHWLFYTLKQKLNLISNYIFMYRSVLIYLKISICISGYRPLNCIMNCDYSNGKDYSFSYNKVSPQFPIIYLPHNIITTFIPLKTIQFTIAF
jgi:hypothetical protein